MRLLDVYSLEFNEQFGPFTRNSSTGEPQLKEFTGNKIPEYAILSHTWGDDEVLFSDLCNRSGRLRRGFWKLEYTVWQARKDGYQWVWIDTCCIDKSSSAELQEAINSMFNWYRLPKVCYVYLEDLVRIPGEPGWEKEVITSSWFTRGWTLQELLAPEKIFFYSKTWRKLYPPYTREGEGFPAVVSKATGIDYLYHLTRPRGENALDRIRKASVAIRMSWAANRKTTRHEDMAYSLLGLFEVNMPLLYGEGSKAFVRLQEEIIRRFDDTSIFHWAHVPDSGKQFTSGLLAPTPRCFEFSSDVEIGRLKAPFDMTNKGLRLEMPLIQIAPNEYLGILDSDYALSNQVKTPTRHPLYDAVYLFVNTPEPPAKMAICLRQLQSGGEQFSRVYTDRIARVYGLERSCTTAFFVRQPQDGFLASNNERSGPWRALLSSDIHIGVDAAAPRWTIQHVCAKDVESRWQFVAQESETSTIGPGGEKPPLSTFLVVSPNEGLGVVVENAELDERIDVVFYTKHRGLPRPSNMATTAQLPLAWMHFGTIFFNASSLHSRDFHKECPELFTLQVAATDFNVKSVPSGLLGEGKSWEIHYTLQLRVDWHAPSRRASTADAWPSSEKTTFRGEAAQEMVEALLANMDPEQFVSWDCIKQRKTYRCH